MFWIFLRIRRSAELRRWIERYDIFYGLFLKLYGIVSPWLLIAILSFLKCNFMSTWIRGKLNVNDERHAQHEHKCNGKYNNNKKTINKQWISKYTWTITIFAIASVGIFNAFAWACRIYVISFLTCVFFFLLLVVL